MSLYGAVKSFFIDHLAPGACVYYQKVSDGKPVEVLPAVVGNVDAQTRNYSITYNNSQGVGHDKETTSNRLQLDNSNM